MKLFGHPDSGHALKVKFFMDWARIEHQYEQVDVWADKNTRSHEFLQASRFAEVPTLIDGNQHLIQSNAILLYLADRFVPFASRDERQQCVEWLLWEANKIGMCLPQLRADKKFPSYALCQGARDWLLARYTHDVAVLDNQLSDIHPFVLGDKLTIADFSLCAYLMHAQDADVNVPKNVQHWLHRLQQLDAWQAPDIMLA